MSPNARGAIAMSLAMLCFVLNDLAMKGVVARIPPGEALVVRGFFAIAFASALSWRLGAFRHASLLLHPAVLGRCALEGAAAACFMTALPRIPFATLSATLQLTPLIATALAALLLREKVGWRRWSAMLSGLLGMVIILQPWSAAISAMALLGVAAAFLASSRDIATRAAPAETPTILFAFGSVVAIMLTGGAMSLGETWEAPTTVEVLRLAMASTLVVGANFFVSKSMRIGDVSFVAPFRYTSVFWAMAGAWLFYAEEPGPEVYVGAAIIVAAGLYTFRRERVRKAPIASTAPPTSGR